MNFNDAEITSLQVSENGAPVDIQDDAPNAPAGGQFNVVLEMVAGGGVAGPYTLVTTCSDRTASAPAPAALTPAPHSTGPGTSRWRRGRQPGRTTSSTRPWPWRPSRRQLRATSISTRQPSRVAPCWRGLTGRSVQAADRGLTVSPPSWHRHAAIACPGCRVTHGPTRRITRWVTGNPVR